MEEKFIVVTNWEKVDSDEFYITDKKWLKKELDKTNKEIKELQEMAKEGRLYRAYIVKAIDFALYWQMDASEVFIDSEWNEIARGETSVIDTNFNYKQEYFF
jgi:hypothetical protein